MKEYWSVRDNGGKGNLVGIVSNKSNWFIATEVLLQHAKLICELFNASQPVIEADADKKGRCPVCGGEQDNYRGGSHYCDGTA